MRSFYIWVSVMLKSAQVDRFLFGGALPGFHVQPLVRLISLVIRNDENIGKVLLSQKLYVILRRIKCKQQNISIFK